MLADESVGGGGRFDTTVEGYQEMLGFVAGWAGHRLLWGNDEVGQAGLALGAQDTELVLTTAAPCAPTWWWRRSTEPWR